MGKALGIDLGTTSFRVSLVEGGTPSKEREDTEARNNAESMAYQVEREIRDLGDKTPIDEKARAEQLISQIRELIRNKSTDIAGLRQLTSDLQQVGYGLSSAACSQSQAPRAVSSASTGAQARGGDDVIDVSQRRS